MSASRLRRRVRLSLALALLPGALAVRLLVSAAPETEGPPTVFTGVDAQRLLAKWDIKAPAVYVEPTGVVYHPGQRPHGLEAELQVGVFASLPAAQEAFRRLSGTPMGPRQVRDGAPGDQFLYWPRDRDGPTCRVLLRRGNAVLSAHWRGSVEEAVGFARAVDQVLLTDSQVAPQGSHIPLPSLDLAVRRPAVAGTEVEMPFKATRGGPVRLCRVATYRADGGPMEPAFLAWDSSQLVSEGTPSLVFPKPGDYELTLHFASELNVVFTQSLTVNAMDASSLASSQAVGWLSFGDDLYFLRDAGAEWPSAPAQEREWIQLARGTFQDIKEPGAVREQALAELRQYVESRWLPDEVAPLLRVARNWARPDGRTCFCASYKLRGGYNVALMGELGRQFWLYIEEPEPVPPGRAALAPADVLRDDLLKSEQAADAESNYPRAAFMCRSFRRYRAYKPDGPYEPVRILFVNVQLPGQVNLRFPGYP